MINKAAEKDAQATLDAKDRAEKLPALVSQDARISDYSKNARRDGYHLLYGKSLLRYLLSLRHSLRIKQRVRWFGKTHRSTLCSCCIWWIGYLCRKTSGGHRQTQRQSEHMALQFSAVRPYLEDVTDKGQRDALLFKLADKFFSRKENRTTQKKATRIKGEEVYFCEWLVELHYSSNKATLILSLGGVAHTLLMFCTKIGSSGVVKIPPFQENPNVAFWATFYLDRHRHRWYITKTGSN